MKQVNIKIDNTTYQLLKKIPETQKTILKKGIQYYLNQDIKKLTQTQTLEKEKQKIQNQIEEINTKIKQNSTLHTKKIGTLEKEKQKITNQIEDLKIEHDLKKTELEQKKETLNKTHQEITNKISELEQTETINIITQEHVETVQEYQQHSNYQRGLDNIKHALKLSKLPLADFIITKEDYILRVCENNSLDKDKLIDLLKQQQK